MQVNDKDLAKELYKKHSAVSGKPRQVRLGYICES